MKASSGTMLGLIVTDQTVVCAEVHARGARPTVRKLAVLPIEPEYSLAKPEALGAKLAEFLKAQSVTSNKAVVGVPARWLISAEKELPPAPLEQIHSVLRLQGERMASADSGEMAFDYAGELQGGRGGRALLVAMRKAQVIAIEQALDAAGIDVVAITPLALALAAADKGAGPLIAINNGGAEVVLRGTSSPRMLRHVSLPLNGSGLPSLTPLGMDLRRSLALSSDVVSGEASLFDGVGFNGSQLSEFSDRAGFKIIGGDPLSRLGVTSETTPPGGESIGRFAPAIALALSGLQPKLLPLNFADSKLAPPPEPRFGRRTIIASAVGLLVILLLVGLWINNQRLASELADIQAEQAAIAPDVSAAQAVKDRVDFSNGFFKTRTPMLQCLRDITESFRVEEPIWLSTLAVAEDQTPKVVNRYTVRLEGRTTEQQLSLALSDRIRSNKSFEGGIRDVAGASGKQKDQSSFSLGFVYTPEVK